jgi:co-chaperonin GroES (HSP10)
MKARGTHILLKKVEEEVKTSNGLTITDISDSKIRYRLAKVISVGEDVLDLDEGMEVYYDIAAASDIRLDGVKYLVVTDRGVVTRP